MVTTDNTSRHECNTDQYSSCTLHKHHQEHDTERFTESRKIQVTKTQKKYSLKHFPRTSLL